MMRNARAFHGAGRCGLRLFAQAAWSGRPDTPADTVG